MSGSAPPSSSPASHPPHEAPESPRFRKLGEWVLRHRAAILIFNVIVTVTMVWGLTSLRLDMSSDPFLPADSAAKRLNERFKDDFGYDIYSLVVVEGDVFSEDYLRRLKALHDELGTIDVEIPSLGKRRDRPDQPKRAPEPEDDAAFADFGDDDDGWGEQEGGTIFEELLSLVNARQTLGEEDGIRVEGLLDRWPSEAELPALKKRVLADRTLVGRLVGKQGRHSLIVARTDYMDDEHSPIVNAAIQEIVVKHEAPGFHILVGGLPSLLAVLTKSVMEDTGTLFGGALLVMIIVLGFVFRHWIGVVGPVLAVTTSAIWAMGLSALLDRPMTQVSMIIPAFLICVGVGDAVHMQSAYRDQLRDGVVGKEAIVRAVALTGLPVLFTSITTTVGLLSFQFASAVGIKDMGLLGAFGVLVAMIQCLTLVPVMLSWHTKGRFGARETAASEGGALDRFLAWCNAASSTPTRMRVVIALSLLLAGASAYGGSLVYVSHDDIRSLDPDLPTRVAFETVNEHIGGNGDLSIFLQAHDGKNLADRELMLGLEELETYVRAYRDPATGDAVVANVSGLLDIVRETHRALHGGKQSEYRIPDTQQGVVDMFTLFQNSGAEQMKRVATVDLAHGVMQVNTNWMDSRRFEPLMEYLRNGIDKYIGDKAKVELTGTGALFVEVTNSTIMDLVRSFSVAFLGVTLFMAFLLRSAKIGAIAMLPNLLPIAGVLGLMGYAGIWLDYSNVLIASIALGIVVDDTIHFLHQFRAQHLATGSVEAGLEHAYRHTGRAMVITSVVLVGGFAVFLLASLGNVRLFGFLTDITVAGALFVDLVLTPALLRALIRSKVTGAGAATA